MSTVEQLRAHIESRVAEIEAVQERVRNAPRGSLGTHNDPVDSRANGKLSGAKTAYRDVLSRLPGAGRK